MERKVLNYGFVRLVDSMPIANETDNSSFEASIAQMARVSYGKGTKSLREDQALVQYLLEHSHTSPFEGVTLKFHIKMPIFVARQWVRHRTASINEYSARYSVMTDEFYVPEASRLNTQDSLNKQMSSSGLITDQERAVAIFDKMNKDAYSSYKELLELGLSRELARCVLPVSIYTEMYWVMNLHNLFRFLRLRMDKHAQYEIIEYANAIYSIMYQICPNIMRCWENSQVNNINIFADEKKIINECCNLEEEKLIHLVDSKENISSRKKTSIKEKLLSIFSKG
jgi:thymidylate synthase (FAD)